MTKKGKINAYRKAYELYNKGLVDFLYLYAQFHDCEITEMFEADEIELYDDVKCLNETILLSCAELLRLDFKID